jgi:hypothetical protein
MQRHICDIESIRLIRASIHTISPSLNGKKQGKIENTIGGRGKPLYDRNYLMIEEILV